MIEELTGLLELRAEPAVQQLLVVVELFAETDRIGFFLEVQVAERTLALLHHFAGGIQHLETQLHPGDVDGLDDPDAVEARPRTG